MANENEASDTCLKVADSTTAEDDGEKRDFLKLPGEVRNLVYAFHFDNLPRKYKTHKYEPRMAHLDVHKEFLGRIHPVKLKHRIMITPHGYLYKRGSHPLSVTCKQVFKETWHWGLTLDELRSTVRIQYADIRPLFERSGIFGFLQSCGVRFTAKNTKIVLHDVAGCPENGWARNDGRTSDMIVNVKWWFLKHWKESYPLFDQDISYVCKSKHDVQHISIGGREFNVWLHYEHDIYPCTIARDFFVIVKYAETLYDADKQAWIELASKFVKDQEASNIENINEDRDLKHRMSNVSMREDLQFVENFLNVITTMFQNLLERPEHQDRKMIVLGDIMLKDFRKSVNQALGREGLVKAVKCLRLAPLPMIGE